MKDLIERQVAIDAIEHRLAEPAYQHTGEDWYVGMNCAESELYELPSAQPERKKGKWIRHDEIKNVYGGICIECSECGEKYVVQHILDEKYCRNCGAKMEVGENAD